MLLVATPFATLDAANGSRREHRRSDAGRALGQDLATGLGPTLKAVLPRRATPGTGTRSARKSTGRPESRATRSRCPKPLQNGTGAFDQATRRRVVKNRERTPSNSMTRPPCPDLTVKRSKPRLRQSHDEHRDIVTAGGRTLEPAPDNQVWTERPIDEHC